MEFGEGEAAKELLKGRADIWRHIFAFVESMALRCAIDLRLADTINSHSRPITLSEIASGTGSSSVHMAHLARIMRFLVHKEIFTVQQQPDGGEIVYGLNQKSRWLLHDSELSLAPMIKMQVSPWLLAPWHSFSQCISEGCTSFSKAHGCEMWDFANQNPEFNEIFNEAMSCTSEIMMKTFLSQYRDGFDNIMSLVDVGGGSGGHVAAIVKAYPHIKGINFDLPHVVATAPEHEGVSHVAGNMFEIIPKADAIFMKWILHDWADESCVEILKNCLKAIPEKTGKVIIVDIVLQQNNHSNEFDDKKLAFDLIMMAHLNGKERTEEEWKKILEEGGFPQYKIIKIPALLSIIEAYPQ